jgi:Polyketide cyclase / dehydrase and lipid transport
MPRVSHYLVVDRPVGAVFDVVTTGRFWTEWHPATRGVEGDVDHPARLGDQITEHVTIAGFDGSGTWTVVERDPPYRLALETSRQGGRLRISYQHSQMASGGTRLQRDLDYLELGPQVSVAMQAQSAGGVIALARLLEREIPAADAGIADTAPGSWPWG